MSRKHGVTALVCVAWLIPVSFAIADLGAGESPSVSDPAARDYSCGDAPCLIVPGEVSDGDSPGD